MSVNGFEEVEKALQEVSELDTRQAVGEAIQFVRSAAVENCMQIPENSGRAFLRKPQRKKTLSQGSAGQTKLMLHT